MSKSLLFLSLCCAVVFALSFLLVPDFNKFVYSHLAAVMGIDINKVRQWQLQNGLNRDLAIGDRGVDVRLLQEALNKNSPNFQEKNITGYYGSRTAQAISDFQLAQGLNTNGRLDSDTRVALNNIYFNELCPVGQGDIIYSDEIMVHINREIPLPVDYAPHNLVNISDFVKTVGIICLKQDVIPFLKQMFADAADQNIKLVVTSGFRRPEMQSIIQKMWQLIEGDTSKKGVAEPRHSEHQLGTAVDLSGKSVNDASATDIFDGTTEDVWLKQNAYKYGFVMSYPKDKLPITGYKYEPWHYRFVGTDVAKQIFDRQISVEEYFSSLKGILNF
jgi:zinc D-Ala-D-Ala carboxypeptidase